MQADGKATAAEQLFAQARVQQEMRAAGLARQRAARRRWLLFGVPAGFLLGWLVAKSVGQPAIVWAPFGACLGAAVALIVGRRA